MALLGVVVRFGQGCRRHDPVGDDGVVGCKSIDGCSVHVEAFVQRLIDEIGLLRFHRESHFANSSCCRIEICDISWLFCLSIVCVRLDFSCADVLAFKLRAILSCLIYSISAAFFIDRTVGCAAHTLIEQPSRQTKHQASQ